MLTQQRCPVMTAFWIGLEDVERLGWVDCRHPGMACNLSRGEAREPSSCAEAGAGQAIKRVLTRDNPHLSRPTVEDSAADRDSVPSSRAGRGWHPSGRDILLVEDGPRCATAGEADKMFVFCSFLSAGELG